MQGITILGIVALGYLAVENWTFGFERIVDLRLRFVNEPSRELSRADAELSSLVQRRNLMATASSAKRDELRGGIAKRDASIAALTAQLNKEAEVHRLVPRTADKPLAGWHGDWQPTATPRPDNCLACQAGRSIAALPRPNAALAWETRCRR